MDYKSIILDGATEMEHTTILPYAPMDLNIMSNVTTITETLHSQQQLRVVVTLKWPRYGIIPTPMTDIDGPFHHCPGPARSTSDYQSASKRQRRSEESDEESFTDQMIKSEDDTDPPSPTYSSAP
jgi:hypothetical protein